MKKISLSGGVYIPQSKITAAITTDVMPTPERVFIPVQQHIGEPARPIVKVGDYVKVGQLIATAEGPKSANIHSSVSGRVISLYPHSHPIGKDSLAVQIETTEQENQDYSSSQTTDWLTLSSSELKNIIAENGIVGMGGKGLPVIDKLNNSENQNIKMLIINATECEPYITCDNRLIIEKSQKLLIGIKIILRILDIKNSVIVLSDNMIDAYDKMNTLIKDEPRISCIIAKSKYPIGDERLILSALTNKENKIYDNKIVFNPATLAAISDAVKNSQPLIERIVTVSGLGIKTPKNLLVKIGTPIKDLISYCGGLTDDCDIVVNDGPMAGISQWSQETPVIKTTRAILCLTKNQTDWLKNKACINCGACRRTCPSNLVPAIIVREIKNKNFEEIEKMGIDMCTECGCCTYVCPSRIDLMHYLRWGRDELHSINLGIKT